MHTNNGVANTRRGLSFHFVEVMVGVICALLIAVSLAFQTFGTSAIIGSVGLVLLARSLVVNRH